MHLRFYTTLPLLFLLLLPFTTPRASGEETSELFTDWEEIIGAPPEQGTSEEEQDVATLMDFQKNRTKAECKEAATQEKIGLKAFFGGKSGPLSKKEIWKNQFLWFKYVMVVGLPSFMAKNHFKRPRPFKAFPQIKPCVKKPGSYSYPSGHTSTARAMAHVLAMKYPERAALFFKRADEVARNRMLGGVHYPSDVAAGKILADHFIDRLKSDKAFLEDLAND